MSKKYIPETGPKVIPAHIEEKTVTGITNPLPAGTRIRATLGETVIVGTVTDWQSPYAVFEIRIAQPVFDRIREHLLDVRLWPESGWEFEVLDEAVAA